MQLLALACVLGAWSPGALDIATPLTGRIAFGTVTHTTAGTADTIKTLTGRRRILLVMNNLNTDCELTYGGADLGYLPALQNVSIDLSASGLTLADSKAVGIYHLGVAPTSGNVGVTAL